MSTKGRQTCRGRSCVTYPCFRDPLKLVATHGHWTQHWLVNGPSHEVSFARFNPIMQVIQIWIAMFYNQRLILYSLVSTVLKTDSFNLSIYHVTGWQQGHNWCHGWTCRHHVCYGPLCKILRLLYVLSSRPPSASLALHVGFQFSKEPHVWHSAKDIFFSLQRCNRRIVLIPA